MVSAAQQAAVYLLLGRQMQLIVLFFMAHCVETCDDANPDASFGRDVRKWGSISEWRPSRKLYPKNFGPKNYHFRAHNGWSLVLRYENVRFRFSSVRYGHREITIWSELAFLFSLCSLACVPSFNPTQQASFPGASQPGT